MLEQAEDARKQEARAQAEMLVWWEQNIDGYSTTIANTSSRPVKHLTAYLHTGGTDEVKVVMLPNLPPCTHFTADRAAFAKRMKMSDDPADGFTTVMAVLSFNDSSAQRWTLTQDDTLALASDKDAERKAAEREMKVKIVHDFVPTWNGAPDAHRVKKSDPDSCGRVP
ncbi:hypothetical protein ACFFS2_39270 [Streptomyces aurantiacus]|uniref:Uncharacterized protein n=1 Tax=Streptomyces aurantiacus TaxID=47760 RepID=A0A7G1PDA1_9ACTN|nr:hypothetical protein [Streptomyces aurantiacus]BCL33429.1 hypothetical protein GCM10017557_82880 [Streptomyces aurantiacus]